MPYLVRGVSVIDFHTIRYDTIEEFNEDSAECN